MNNIDTLKFYLFILFLIIFFIFMTPYLRNIELSSNFVASKWLFIVELISFEKCMILLNEWCYFVEVILTIYYTNLNKTYAQIS